MKYIVNNSNDPAYNIALEAYAFIELTDIDERTLQKIIDKIDHTLIDATW